MIVTASLHGTQHKKRLCEQQAGELACCVLAQGTQRDASIFIWHSCISPGYNCEAVQLTVRNRRLLGIQPVTTSMVVGGATTQS